MKKIITLSIVAALVLSMGIIAFADSTKEIPQWYDDMMQWRKQQVNEAVKNGEITEEQAKYCNERMEEARQYHEENGFGYGNGMKGRFRDDSTGKFGRGRFMGGFAGGFGPGFCHR